jgi:serine/threonine protein kinase
MRTPEAPSRLTIPQSIVLGELALWLPSPQEPIGSGSFGEVYLAVGSGGERCALKIEPIVSVHASQIENELASLTILKDSPRVPRVLASGRVGEQHRGFAMTLFGESLESVFEAGGRASLPALRVCVAGVGLLRALRDTHAAGLVHRDLKPENFLEGAGAGAAKARTFDEPQIYLVDFGLSAPYARGARPREDAAAASTHRCIVGTSRYASVAAHAGRAQVPADDVEALLYCLAYLARAERLPWQGLRVRDKKARNAAVAAIKASTSTAGLCSGAAAYLRPFGELARAGADPDYARLEALLRAAVE